jgi:hypothetical protein
VAEHPDVQRFTRALAARTKQSLDAEETSLLEELFADDVVWHGTASGKDDVIAQWNAYGHNGGGGDVSEVYADGLHTVSVVRRSDGNGQTIEQAGIFHLVDGKVTEFWSIPSEQAVADAFARREPVPQHRYMEVFEIAEATRERNTFEPDDLAKIHAFLREDVEWHGAGDIPGVKGRDTVIGLYKQFKDATGGSMHLGMGSKFIDDSHAASIVHLTATRADNPDRKMDVMEVNLFHLDENGKAFEFWGVPADQEEMDAFWLP